MVLAVDCYGSESDIPETVSEANRQMGGKVRSILPSDLGVGP